MFKKFLLLTIAVFSLSINAQTFGNLSNNSFQKSTIPLKPEEAFTIQEEINIEKDYLKIIFDIKEEHYLYEKDFYVKVNGFNYNNYLITTETIDDEFYGKTNVIKNSFSIKINNYKNINNVKINYRGCSPKFSICYQEQEFFKTYNDQVVIDKENSFYNSKEEYSTDEDSNQFFGFEFLKDNQGNILLTLLIMLLVGILVSLTPCVLPMIPIVSSIVISQNITKKYIAAYFASMYVIGSSIAYGMIGLLSSVSTISIQSITQTPIFIFIAGVLLLFFGLILFDFLNLPSFNRFNSKINEKINKINLNGFSIIIIGFLSSLIISPCVAAPLASIIIYTTTLNNPILSFIYLFTFGIGSGLILIFIATNLNRVRIKSGSYMNFVKYLMGFLLIIIAIYIFNRILNNYLIIDLLYHTAFFLFIIVLMRNISFNKTALFLLILTLSVGRIGVSEFLQYENVSSTINQIESIEDIKIGNKTFIKVSADWCVYCRDLEENLFKDIDVVNSLADYKVLTLDLTSSSKEKSKILSKYNIVAPPAVIILNEDGSVKYTYNGKISKDKLLNNVNN